jgi:hypothetical protein
MNGQVKKQLHNGNRKMKRNIALFRNSRPRAALAIIVLAFVVLAGEAAAQAPSAESWPRIETGGLLYLSCALRAEVRLDESPAGTTPLLLELKPGEHNLEVIGPDSVCRRRLVVVPSGGLDRLVAVLESYRGGLRLSGVEAGAQLSVDGGSPMPLPSGTWNLAQGEHDILVTAEGKVPFASKVLIPRDGFADLHVELEKGFPLRFVNPPPKGSILAVLDKDGKIQRRIDPWSTALLPSGTAKFRLVLPSGYGVDFAWDPGSAAAIDAPYIGRLLLGSLPAGSSVEIDGLPAPAAGADGSYALSPGMHNLKIQRTGYLTFVLFCEIQLGAETRPKIVFLEDSAFVQAKKNAVGLPILLTGGLLTVGGFIFNIDDVAIAFSSDYQGYKLWKYLGLGFMGGGAAAFVSGLGIMTIRL